MDDTRLRAMLIRHEGWKLTMYNDTLGIPTIGAGRNLRDTGITSEEAMVLLDNDIARWRKMLPFVFPDWDDFEEARQAALIDMTHNLGLAGLRGFKQMIGFVNAGDWARAAQAAKDSKWYGQVGIRGPEIVSMLASGLWQEGA